MFDPHDWFNIRRSRAVCPVHGKRDRNLEIKRHKTQPKWVLTCHSHHCTLQEIAQAAGFNPAVIYDNDRDPDWVNETDWIVTPATARKVVTKDTEPNLGQLVDDTLGPNPCTRLHWLNQETDEVTEGPCNGKRCHDCGPRRQMELELQLSAAFGDYCYIETYATKDELNTTIERIRKQTKRTDGEWKYTVVGDDYLGWILASDKAPSPSTTLKTLTDWMRRIIHAYRYGDSRIRRSRSMSRVSNRKRKGKSGQRSIWQLVTRRWVPLYAVPDTMEELLVDIEVEQHFRKRDWLDRHTKQERNRAFVPASEWVDPA